MENLRIDHDRMHSKVALERELISEAAATGFSHKDQQVAFYSQIWALVEKDWQVLDFGAGRGEWYLDEPVLFRREIQNFRGKVGKVFGCDVDSAVRDNPTIDEAAILNPDEPLPYRQDQFDLVVSRYVLEHLRDPAWFASEMARIVKPGGWVCAVTPNKFGYVALAARMVPNRLHAKVLEWVQPHREERDVFPTVYKLNSPSDLKSHFGDKFEIYYYRSSAVPSYHFGKPLIFKFFQLVHRFLPPVLETGLYILMRRRA